jgi:hypothetical protein
MDGSTTKPEGSGMPESRRRLLETAGRLAVITPPAITLLLTGGGACAGWASGAAGWDPGVGSSNYPPSQVTLRQTNQAHIDQVSQAQVPVIKNIDNTKIDSAEGAKIENVDDAQIRITDNPNEPTQESISNPELRIKISR